MYKIGQMGIYQIKNLVNGKIYIGSSINIPARWGVHRYRLRKGIHKNPPLQNAWNKYGEESFEFTVLEIVKDINDVLPKEQLYLDTRNPDYNIAIRAGANQLGRPLSEEVKNKIRETKHKNRDNFSGENNHFYGKTHSEETKKKLSEIAKKRKHSDERKMKIGVALTGEKSHYAKLTWEKVNEIRKQFESGEYSEAELVRLWGMSQSAINKLINYRTWRNI